MSPEEIKDKFEHHEGRIMALEKGQIEITVLSAQMKADMDQIKTDVQEIVSLLRDLKGAWKVFGFMTKAVKPIATIGALVASASYLWSRFAQ